MTEKQQSNEFVATCVIYFAIFLLLTVMRIAGALGFYSLFSGLGAEIFFTLIAQVGIMTLLPVIAMVRYRKKHHKQPEIGMSFSEYCTMKGAKTEPGVWKSWGFGKTTGRVIAFAFLLGVLMFFFNVFVSTFFNTILALFGFRHMGGGSPMEVTFWAFMVALFLGAVLPGFCEEVTHRGLLMKGFAGRLGIMKAVMLSSILFGLIHMNVVQVFFCIVLGYIMALAMLATRSAWTAVIMHFVNNAIAVYLMFGSANGWFLGNILDLIFNMGGLSILFVFVFFAVCYWGMMQIIHNFARENYVKDRLAIEEGPVQLPRFTGSAAIRFYLTAGETRQKVELRPVEKTLLYGLLFLGTVITGMTLVWGFL